MSFARRDRCPSAFTLIELLAVMAILAILATIGLGAIQGAQRRAAIARTKSDLAALSTALADYRRAYGDYPQLGEFAQASATPASTATGPGLTTAQAKLFNCLTGVFGPSAFTNDDRLSGPNFLDVGKFSLNGTLTAATFLVPTANAPKPPFKQEQNVCLLDPWGHRYLYYYKSAKNTAAWQAASYVLYSAGATVAASGAQTPPINPTTGVFLATQSTETADNLYANP